MLIFKTLCKKRSNRSPRSARAGARDLSVALISINQNIVHAKSIAKKTSKRRC